MSVCATVRGRRYTRLFPAGPHFMDYEKRAGLSVAQPLLSLIEREALPGTGVDGSAAMLRQLAPRNAQLLEKRDGLQAKIDDRYTGRDGAPLDVKAQIELLREIG